jgi:hypothetical protein
MENVNENRWVIRPIKTSRGRLFACVAIFADGSEMVMGFPKSPLLFSTVDGSRDYINLNFHNGTSFPRRKTSKKNS